jgi:hypothetical protein
MSEDSKQVDFSTIEDPYAQREAAKYEQPIPSRELILQLIEKVRAIPCGCPLMTQSSTAIANLNKGNHKGLPQCQ